MRVTVLHRYLMRQMATMLGLSLAALLSLFLTVRLLDLIRLLLGRALDARQGLALFVSVLPPLLLPMLPTAVLAATFLTFRALAAQNEITAMKAAGLGPSTWLRAVLGFGLATTLAALAISAYGIPWAAATQGELLAGARAAGAVRLLLARGVAEPMTGLALRGRPAADDPAAVENVVLMDRRSRTEPAVVVARRAIVSRTDAGAAWSLLLMDGTVTRVATTARGEPAVARFETLDVTLPSPTAGVLAADLGLRPLRELLRLANDGARGADERRAARLEFHRRVALPFACLVVALAAAPIGIRADPNSRTAGATPAVLVFLAYYTLCSV
jgi:lipopolysaccharide export system permease protein